jgi:hypothetical protein
MANQEVIFEQGGPLTGDSGERGNLADGIDSIKPYADGERAVAANFDRPPENLRKRTEVLRSEAEDQKYLQDGDMRWILTSGKADGLHDPGTEWPVIEVWEQHPTDPLFRWYFQLHAGAAVVVQPLNTPRVDKQETKTWEFPLAGPVTGWIDVQAFLRGYSKANLRRIIWQEAGPGDISGPHSVPGFCKLELSGDDGSGTSTDRDRHVLTITINNVGTTQLFQLSTAFADYVDELTLAGFTAGVRPLSDLSTLVTLADIPVVDYTMSGTFDRELHYIQSATFDAFFTASADNLLEDGDTLAVVWDYLVDPILTATTGRRQAIPSNGIVTEVLVGQLFKTSAHPEYIPLSIPLCKRIKNELVWLDGTVATEGMTQAIRLGENGYTVERIFSAPTTVPISMTSMWYGAALPPTWGTTQAALDGIVADLATAVAPKSGADLIGMRGTFPLPFPSSLLSHNVPVIGESLYSTVWASLYITNNKAALGAGGPLYTDPHETITGRWLFDNHMRIGADHSFLRDSFGDSNFKLVYRNNCNTGTPVTEVNDEIDWSTYSIYERTSTPGSPFVDRITVFGAYLSDLATGDDITTPSADSGYVRVLREGSQLGLRISAHKYIAGGAPVTLDITDSGAWDFSYTEYNAMGVSASRVEAGPGSEYLWYVDQIVYGGIDLHTESAGHIARVQIATKPLNTVIEGFYAIPDPLVSWTPNRVTIGPGRALVNGQPIISSANQTINPTDVSARMNGVTLPAADDTGGAGPVYTLPCWYYVWLRKDGSLFLGKESPITDIMGGIPGETLYRPVNGEKHGGYAQQDYVLVDVVMCLAIVVPGGIGVTAYYFDATFRIGGGERRFVTRLHPKAVAPYNNDPIHFLVRLTEPPVNDANFTIISLQQNFSVGVGSPIPGLICRSPGLPVGVTSKALIAYSFDSNMGAADWDYYRLKYSTLSNAYSISDIHPMLECGNFPAAANNHMIQSGLVGIATGIDLPDRPYGYIQTQSENSLAGSSFVHRTYLMGFFWTRSEGLQSYLV